MQYEVLDVLCVGVCLACQQAGACLYIPRVVGCAACGSKASSSSKRRLGDMNSDTVESDVLTFYNCLQPDMYVDMRRMKWFCVGVGGCCMGSQSESQGNTRQMGRAEENTRVIR